MNTWSHLCGINDSFTNLPVEKVCDNCGLSHQVQALRYQGYDPKPLMPIKKKVESSPLRRRVAALLLPKVTPTTIDENQHDYYDRQG
jgi:hypothetical protein